MTTPGQELIPPTHRSSDARAGSVIKLSGIEHVVKPACEVKDRGYWACVTHDKGFPSNITAASHEVEPGHHTMTWVCLVDDHGPETPQ